MAENQELSTSKEQGMAAREQRQDVRKSPQGGSSFAADDSRSMLPRVDVLEDDTGITLLADLPGVPREKLDLKVEGDTLLIEGTVSTPTPQRMEAVYVEVRVPRFRRGFTLSRELDPARIEAGLKDGVLTLRIPKHEHAQPRRIPVSVS